MNITKKMEFSWDSVSRIKYHNEQYTFDILYVSHISSVHFNIFQFLINALNDKLIFFHDTFRQIDDLLIGNDHFLLTLRRLFTISLRLDLEWCFIEIHNLRGIHGDIYENIFASE